MGYLTLCICNNTESLYITARRLECLIQQHVLGGAHNNGCGVEGVVLGV